MNKEAIAYFEGQKERLEEFRNIYPSPDTVGYQATTKEIGFHELAISALSKNKGDLISRQAVLDGIAEWIVSGYADSEADCSHISSLVTHLPSVENKGEFEGMTNGEVIKALFPNGKVIERDEATGYEQMLDVENSYCSWFDSLWWNAPYQKGGE